MCTNCDRGAALFYPELFQEYVKLPDEQENDFPSYQSLDGNWILSCLGCEIQDGFLGKKAILDFTSQA